MDAGSRYPDLAADRQVCQRFIAEFRRPTAAPAEGPKFGKVLQEVADRERTTVRVCVDDLVAFGEPALAQRVERNARRYEMIFAAAIDELLPPPSTPLDETQRDALDVLHEQRRARVEERRAQDAAAAAVVDPDDPEEAALRAKQAEELSAPRALTRRFAVHLLPRAKAPAVAVRAVGARDIGSLVSVKGMVTRVSDVKPLVTVVTYTCDGCGLEVFLEITGRTFMPETTCPSCSQPGSGRGGAQLGRLQLQTRGSKFTKFQEIKLQELPDQVPVGHIPRSMTVLARGELCRQCAPGNVVTFSGVFLPSPYTGYRAIRAGLISDVFLELTAVEQHKQSFASATSDEALLREIEEVHGSEDVYGALARSIAPEIYGHEDIKKALLLLLVGGVTLSKGDGLKIRGDINVLLLGDPGLGKSQLIKQIASISPRGVYTTGKGSSGVGLTAAITKDAVSGEMALEGGALVLADMGICCIDEFDKMEDGDRTAIHEVMEQQTVSIAKAGITTTLNARTAVLAAANPQYGRYNRRKSPSENINLPNALLSRFDLLFLMLDVANEEADMQLARHITHVHMHGRAPDAGDEDEPDERYFDADFLRAYIAKARTFDPVVPPDLTPTIVAAYVSMRNDQSDAATAEDAQMTMTARQLLSILRLAQALARLRFSEAVAQDDVDEAIRLVKASKASLLDDELPNEFQNPIDGVWRILREEYDRRRAAGAGPPRIPLDHVKQRALHAGYSNAQFDECLREHEALSTLAVEGDYLMFTLAD